MKGAAARGRQQLTQFLGGFSTGQKAMVGLALVGGVVALLFFSSWASKPSYAPLFTNLAPADASAITDKLSASKTPFQLEDGGQTVMVPRDRVYQVRLDMSAAKLPSGGTAGYELLDKQGVTTSEFRQRVDYQRALEGELARTIQSIDGVSAATVHLVIPKQDLFSEDASKPTASVLLKTTPGKEISSGQAQAIVHLVSSSVEGLAPEDVTVADAKGDILSTGTADGEAAADARASATHAYEDHVSKSVQDMLSKVLGPGNAVVTVHADLDLDQAKRTIETFDTTNADKPITEATSKEAFSGTGGSVPGGVLGIDATQATATAGGNSTYNKDTATKNYAVGKTTEQLTAAPGSVKRLSVAVLLNSQAKGANAARVESLVRAATGMSADRGDVIAVDSMKFDDSVAKDAAKGLAEAQSAEKMKSMASMVRSALSVLLVLVVLFVLLKAARRTERVPVALPAGFGGALPPGEQAALEPGDPVAVAAAPQPAAVAAARPMPELKAAENDQRIRVTQEIGELIERQPEEVAQLLRSWLADRRT
ncbi:MAG TPA: flagellar basal-body MS-ring/collar protein FliF [Acidimicrobiales bacterium]|nr:flagellar basal-body MS-ring/collar protein FliF [Acidimicrobiales bacterium]